MLNLHKEEISGRETVQSKMGCGTNPICAAVEDTLLNVKSILHRPLIAVKHLTRVSIDFGVFFFSSVCLRRNGKTFLILMAVREC